MLEIDLAALSHIRRTPLARRCPDRGMSRIAIQKVKDECSVDWLEPVSDADYAMPPQA